VSNDTYVYDDANRLASVNGVSYSWDNNGNLLNDGTNTYTYDSANRLKTFTNATTTATYTYNGLNDRLQETVNGSTTTFTMDLNTGLTQALSDGTDAYIYGVGRIAQVNTDTDYFLGDALGSVRQMTNSSGAITYARMYDPYGVVTAGAGSSQSAYGYTNEYTSQGLVYLRARSYSPQSGRFLTRDTWDGNSNQPMSYNKWNYVQANPINYQDPTGHVRSCPSGFTSWQVEWRVDVAEKHVSPTSDPMDTYVAAGIAIQCAGGDEWWNPYSGLGIAQITQMQIETEWGEPIYEYNIWGNQVYQEDAEGNIMYDENGEPVPVIRGYGLRLRCPNGELEKVLNPYDANDAVILMKREIQLVTNACGNKCTATDIFIVAALAQNGPGFTYKDIQGLRKISAENSKLYGNPDVFKDWIFYFSEDAKDHDMINTKIQLQRFVLVVNELRRRRWIVPAIDSDLIQTLYDWPE
jgi:RHS repeat-associated protein